MSHFNHTEEDRNPSPAPPITMRRQDVLDSLECPVCMDVIFPPVKDCCNGHHLCQDCLQKCPKCPLCKEPSGITRNSFAEDFLEKYIVRCHNFNQGCRQYQWKENMETLEGHQEACKFRKIQCWVPNCTEQPIFNSLLRHWEQSHGIEMVEDVEDSKVNGFKFEMTPYAEIAYISKEIVLKESGNAFLCIFQARFDTNEASVYVYGYGPRDVISGYSAQIELKVEVEDPVLNSNTTSANYPWTGPVFPEHEHPSNIEKNGLSFTVVLPCFKSASEILKCDCIVKIKNDGFPLNHT